MKCAKTYNCRDLFPGAIVYYTINGDTRIKLRGKINSIKNHRYDSSVYDKTDGASKATYDCQMTGVRMSCAVLEDLFFRKREYPNVGITLFYHTNLIERINCVVVCLENDGRKKFFMIVPCRESMSSVYIHLIDDLDETLAMADEMVANNAKLENFKSLEGIAKFFGTDTVEEVVYVHTMQQKYVKYYGHPLKLHWRPLPNMTDNPEINTYPEDWYEAWNNANSVAYLGLKYAYKFYLKDGEVMAIFPITNDVLNNFFSIPMGVDKDAFIRDLEYEYYGDIVDKYPEIRPRLNDTVRVVCGGTLEAYPFLSYNITAFRHRDAPVPQYKNSLCVTFSIDGESVNRFCKQIKTAFAMPKDQLPEYSFFHRNYGKTNFKDVEGDCGTCQWTENCRLLKCAKPCQKTN